MTARSISVTTGAISYVIAFVFVVAAIHSPATATGSTRCDSWLKKRGELELTEYSSVSSHAAARPSSVSGGSPGENASAQPRREYAASSCSGAARRTVGASASEWQCRRRSAATRSRRERRAVRRRA